MQRFNQIGRELPSEDDIRDDDNRQAAIASAKLLLREMQQTKAEIDRMLGIDQPLMPDIEPAN
jgi:hypothetical protein